MESFIKEKMKKLPTFVQNLIYLSNYIENVKKMKPASVLSYYIYYKYFFDPNIELSAIIDILLVYKDIWNPSKKPGYFFLNKQYYLPEQEVLDFLKEYNKPGLEDLFYVKHLFEGLFYNILAVFIALSKNPENIKIFNKDKHLRMYINKLESLGLIKREEGDIGLLITNKGWKLQYTIRDLLELIGEETILEDLGI